MSILRDLHVHTNISFDSDADIKDMCEAALSQGLDSIAITNHCDYDDIKKGLYPPFDADSDYKQTAQAKAVYRGRLNVLYGIEIGEPHIFTEEIKSFIRSRNYEFVIGSLHNLENAVDYYYIDFSKMLQIQCEAMWAQYVDTLPELVDSGFIDTLAHITYPLRYMKQGGHSIDIKKTYPKLEYLFKKMAASEVPLEVNTSGLRQNLGVTLPDFDIVELYRECGGELITVGSDAHYPKDVGAGVEETVGKLRKMGFRYINELP